MGEAKQRMRKVYFPRPHLLTLPSRTKPAAFARTSWSRKVGQLGLVENSAFSGNAALKRHFHSFAVNIISRATWGAVSPRSVVELKGLPEKVIVHHTAGKKGSGPKDYIDLLLAIQTLHMGARDLDDISYK